MGRTLIADVDQYPPAEIVDSFGEWRQWIKSGDPSLDGESVELFWSVLGSRGTFSERQFAPTERGYMCLVPATYVESDELLGECYLHGFMYGEAFSKPVFDTWNEKSGILYSLTQGSKADSAASMNKFVLSNGPNSMRFGYGARFASPARQAETGFFKRERR